MSGHVVVLVTGICITACAVDGSWPSDEDVAEDSYEDDWPEDSDED